jgi:hypothetical protein
VNSRWSSRLGRGAAIGLALLLAGCDGGNGGKPQPHAQAQRRAEPPKDPIQADAESLGRELLDIMDRVMAYKSSHRKHLPNSLRQAGLDSLAPLFVRRLSVTGSEPQVTIAFRSIEGHLLRSCRGTSSILEDQMLHNEGFEVTCTLVAGGDRAFTVPPNMTAP